MGRIRFMNHKKWSKMIAAEARRIIKEEGKPGDETTFVIVRNRVNASASRVHASLARSSRLPSSPSPEEFSRVPGTRLEINVEGQLRRLS